MNSFRSPEEAAALKDVAFVLQFGHFPSQGGPPALKVQPATPIPSVPVSKDVTPKPSKQLFSSLTSKSQSSPASTWTPDSKVDLNPFGDEQSPSDDELNPFKDEEKDNGNPFREDEDDKNPFKENEPEPPRSEGASNPIEDEPASEATSEEGEGTATASPSELRPEEVTRTLVEEKVAHAFNLTKLDLVRMVQTAGKVKEAPSIELLLEDMRTVGLELQPSTGSEVPPVVFLRAAVGETSRFTAFTSTSASRATHTALAMAINNMYTDVLELQVWRASGGAVVEAQSGPVLDILAKLITSGLKHSKAASSPATQADSYTSCNGDSEPASTSVGSEPAPETEQEVQEKPKLQADEIDHSNETPIFNVSLCDHQKNTEGVTKVEEEVIAASEEQKDVIADAEVKQEVTLGQTQEPTRPEQKPELHNGEASRDVSQAMDVSDDVSLSPENKVKTSTPCGKSASFQNLDLSGMDDQDGSFNKMPEKSKKRTGSIKLSGLRASIRSKVKKGSKMNLADSTDAPTNTSKPEQLEPKVPRKNTLDREKSRSTLSVASFSNFSFGMFKRIGSKKGKLSHSETASPILPRSNHMDDTSSLASFQIDDINQTELVADCTDSDGRSVTPSPTPPPPAESHTEAGTQDVQEEKPDLKKIALSELSKKSFSSKFTTPRPLRAFKSMREKGGLKRQQAVEGTPEVGPAEVLLTAAQQEATPAPCPDNPKDIQRYLEGIDKGHLKAELLAHTSIPLKSLVGRWKRDAWLPLTVVEDERAKKKKKKQQRTPKKAPTAPSAAHRIHACLALPAPHTELTATSYDTYHITLRKLVFTHLKEREDVRGYQGQVGSVGEVLLQQLIFYNRVTEPHRTLARLLVLVEVCPADPALLLPLLQATRTHLEAGTYLTPQKRQLGASLAVWVRRVLADEFEMLHSAFPRRDDLIQLARLENFLRCFNTMEQCYELRVLFEREAAPATGTRAALPDMLQAALQKHVETWVRALNKECLKQSAAATEEWAAWAAAQKRACVLSEPILSFLTISFHTYQPIFMIELQVDYLYLVLPLLLTATLHLLNPLASPVPDGPLTDVAEPALADAAHRAWTLLTRLTAINGFGVDARLPQHLIPQEYRSAFSRVLIQWAGLSQALALREMARDIAKDDFKAIDDLEGFSQSALATTDLLQALMRRVGEVRWPGGEGPGEAALGRLGQQLVGLTEEYQSEVTRSYMSRGRHYTDRIPAEVCVVLRNVERVCDEVRRHLEQLATVAEGRQLPRVAQELRGRTEHLQEHVDTAADALLHRCLPRLEDLLTQGVSDGSSEYVVSRLEAALRPVQDRLYFAEPLLLQLWHRLLQHATHLRDVFKQGQWREDLRRLRAVLGDVHTFLTDQDHVGLTLLPQHTTEFEELQEELKVLGATSEELVSQFYHLRHAEQQREGEAAAKVLVANVCLTERGLRVHVVQGPGCGAPSGVVVKVRLEPSPWFPQALPQRTRKIKGDPAVFNQVFEFPTVEGDYSGAGEAGNKGGVVSLQVRTPHTLASSEVHYEALVPVAGVPRVDLTDVHMVPHLRLPLTRPWKLASYKPLEALRTRPLDKVAVEFLRGVSERWEPNEPASVQIQDSQKLRATFARANSLRKSGRRPSTRGALVK